MQLDLYKAYEMVGLESLHDSDLRDLLSDEWIVREGVIEWW